jgi:stage V sporulation protein R
MTKHILSDAEVVDYADHHSGTVATRPGQLNPYALGLQLWRHIEARWDRGQHGKAWLEIEDPATRARFDDGSMKGRAKMFEVRRTHNDVSFIDTFLTEDFVREHGMFTTHYDKRTKTWVVDSDEFKDIKRQVLSMISTRGAPRVFVIDANLNNRGELLLRHPHEGQDIQVEHAQRVLGNIALVWGRPVHLQTQLDNKNTTLSHDGKVLRRVSGHTTG